MSDLTAQFNVVSDFSLKGNPNGPWTYGSARNLGQLVPFPSLETQKGVERWYPGNGVHFPDICRNITHKQLLVDGALLSDNALILRPGNRFLHANTYSVVRFTAPESGNYRFQGAFEAMSINYGGTTQSIARDGRKLAENTFIKAHGQIWEFDIHEDMRAREWVDFLVSESLNGDNSNDSTGLVLRVERHSRAISFWLVGLAAAVASIIAFRVRRRLVPRTD